MSTQVRAESRQRRRPELLPVRRKAHGLGVEDLTSLPEGLQSLPQRQLMFPLSVLSLAIHRSARGMTF